MTVNLSVNEFGRVDSIKLSENIDGLTIKHQWCTGKISLHGGQVLAWQPKDQQPVFWLSKAACYQPEKAIRGGIPLCWPWFGAHHNDPKNHAGNHGFARQQTWQVDTIEISAQAVTVVLSWQGEKMHDFFSIACQLKQTLVFGETFTQSLEMVNLSADDIEYTVALHSYFQVSAPQNIKIKELSTLQFDDKLTGESHEGEVLPNGIGPIDRIYHGGVEQTCMRIADNEWQRIIEVTTQNTAQWVFWNPGLVGAENMADVHQNGEQEFVCLEAANTQPQVLAAKSSIVISQQIAVYNH